MNFLTGTCRKVFGLLLHLYPVIFRQEYGEELQSHFDSLLEEARSISGWEFLSVCLRELRDLPINLLRTHLEKKRMYRILRAPSLRFGWKGAIAFGLSFVAVNVLDSLINDGLLRFEFNHVQSFLLDPQAQQRWIFATTFLSWIVASVAGGLLFAALFTGRFRFWRIAGLGTIGYLVPNLVLTGLMYSALVNTKGFNYQWFSWGMEALAGLFLGAIIASVAEVRLRKFVLLGAGAILYPLLIESSARLIWGLLPPASPLFFKPAESYRNFTLVCMLAGLLFGFLMGLILGWGRKTSTAGSQDTT